MKLWTQWLQAVYVLRPACHRARTFVWMALVLMGLCCRADHAGVTSFVRVLNVGGQAYHRFLQLFHSTSLDLDVLISCWVRLCLVLFHPFKVGSRLVCLADGIKAPKEGQQMPGVKYLHQQSASNTKPEYIMGHSLQAISLLVHSAGGQVAAVPLTSRLHEGLVFSNRDSKTLLDKLVALLFSIAHAWDRQVLLIADADYASAKVMLPLLNNGHQLLTRAKSNAVAYMPVPEPARRGKGRPRMYGEGSPEGSRPGRQRLHLRPKSSLWRERCHRTLADLEFDVATGRTHRALCDRPPSGARDDIPVEYRPLPRTTGDASTLRLPIQDRTWLSPGRSCHRC